jgi:hypothetical protein
MKSYLERNNLQYFEKPMKAVMPHLPQDTPAEDISNSLDALGLSVINVMRLTTNRRAPNGQTHVETLTAHSIPYCLNKKRKISRVIQAE